MGVVPEMTVMADRTHKVAPPPSLVFKALVEDRENWLDLAPRRGHAGSSGGRTRLPSHLVLVLASQSQGHHRLRSRTRQRRDHASVQVAY